MHQCLKLSDKKNLKRVNIFAGHSSNEEDFDDIYNDNEFDYGFDDDIDYYEPLYWSILLIENKNYIIII